MPLSRVGEEILLLDIQDARQTRWRVQGGLALVCELMRTIDDDVDAAWLPNGTVAFRGLNYIDGGG